MSKTGAVKIMALDKVPAGSVVMARTSADVTPDPDEDKISRARVNRDAVVRFLANKTGWNALTVTTAGSVKSRKGDARVAVIPVESLGRGVKKHGAGWLAEAQANGTLQGVSTAESVRLWVVQHYGEAMRDGLYIGYVV